MEPILTQEETEAIYSAMNEASAGMAAVEEHSLIESRMYLVESKNTWNHAARAIKSAIEGAIATALGKRVALDLIPPELMADPSEESEEWEDSSPGSESTSVTSIVSIGNNYLLIEIDPALARRYMERRMGAQTDPSDMEGSSNHFTVLERKILTELVLDLAKVVGTKVPGRGDVRILDEETGYFLNENKSPSEPWLEIKFSTFGPPEMAVTFKGPASLFAKQPKGASTLVASRISGSNMEVSVELGRTHIRVSELVSLEPGSFIPLNVAVGDRFTVLVDGIPKFDGEPMVSRGNIAVRVLDRRNNGVSQDA